MIQRLLEACFNRSRTVFVLLGMIFVVGLNAYFKLPKESNPDIKIPIIFVTVLQEGISPEDAERLIIRPLENQLRALEGVKESRSIAFEGGAEVILEFVAGFNSDKALRDVQEKVELAKSDFPAEAEAPKVKELDFSDFPVLMVKLSGQIPDRTLYKMATHLKNVLESEIKNLLNVNILGKRDEVVEILLDPTKMKNLGVTLETLMLQFQQNHLIVPAGNLENQTGSFSLKIPGYIETVQELYRFPLKMEQDAVVCLEDIATIRKTYKDPKGFARDGGTPAVILQLSKRTGTNLIETVQAVRQVVEREKKHWQQHITVDYAQDDSQHIQEMLNDLMNNLVAAVLLVMGVIVVSLGWRSSLLVGVAVPGSFLASMIFLQVSGFTMNTVVLFALILSVGMLVDGAIIVVEYADRKMEEGLPPPQAFLLAATRMFWPVVTSTFTILVVFFPLLFWPGIVGEFMKFLPITLIATLISSIFMAILFIPVLGIYMPYRISAPPPEGKQVHPIPLGRMESLYLPILQRALEHPARVLWGSGGLLLGVILLYPYLGAGVEFFPNVEPNQANILIHARGNLSVYEKDILIKKVERCVLGMPELKSIVTQVAGGQNSAQQGSPDTIGVISLEFIDWKHRKHVDLIVEDILKKTEKIPGLIIEVMKNKPGPPVGKPIQLELHSTQSEKLQQAHATLKAYLESQPALTAFEDSLSPPAIEWQLVMDRAQAAKFGVNVKMLGSAIKLLTNGAILGTYRPEDSTDEIDIVARYPAEERTLEGLRNLQIQTAKGPVSLLEFTQLTPQPRVSEIHRRNNGRVILLKTDLKPGFLADTEIKNLQTWLIKNPLDPEVKLTFKGEEEQQQETQDFLKKAFFLAIFGIAILLVTQFNNYFYALLVLSSAVLSTFGVFVGLILTQQPFGIVMGGIGIIAVAGIIVSNNIIFIDTFLELKKQGLPLRDCILQTGVQRLRPVILTKLTAILGLLPILFRINIDFLAQEITYGAPMTAWWVQLATAIVFGILFASSLTLIVTPCALMVYEPFSLRRFFQRFSRKEVS